MARYKRAPRRGRRSTKLMVFRKRRRRRKKLALKSHSFVERVEDKIPLNSSTLQADGTLLVNYKKSFAMTDIPQWSSYKKLFDDYILSKVVLTMRYNHMIATYSSSTPIVNDIKPLLLIKTDHNDSSTGVSWDDLKQSEKARMCQMVGGRPIDHVLKPAVQVEAYKTLTTSAYCAKFNTSIRTVDDSVPHYGLKIQVKTQPGPAVYDFGSINLEYKYYFTMKNAE